MESITEGYLAGLKHFTELNAFFLGEYYNLNCEMQNNSPRQKRCGEGPIAGVNELRRSHELLKQLMSSFTTMYNKVILVHSCVQPRTDASNQFSTDEVHVFPVLKFGEKLSERMTEKMLEEKRLLQVTDEYTERIYSQKLRKLEEHRKEICDPLPEYEDGVGYDCVGYHPTDSLVAVLSKVIKLNRDKPYRMFLYRVADICREYANIFKEFGLWQFKSVADSLFEDRVYNASRMYVLWFITKLKASTKMKAEHSRLWERTELWSHLQVHINSYIAYAISHPQLIELEEYRFNPNPRSEIARNRDWGSGCRGRLHLRVREEECDSPTPSGELDETTQQVPPTS